EWINNWPDQYESGWIVGHNPGLSELVERLTDQNMWLPTCGLAEISLEVNSWTEVFAGTGRLRGLFTPKSAMRP
ncbi:MAG TPA: histidine phosphatase family protein, partial [Flavobacteriales bacterium]|nr:histidine phosphatase family protein [Flavobacteriales bacterium]